MTHGPLLLIEKDQETVNAFEENLKALGYKVARTLSDLGEQTPIIVLLGLDANKEELKAAVNQLHKTNIPYLGIYKHLQTKETPPDISLPYGVVPFPVEKEELFVLLERTLRLKNYKDNTSNAPLPLSPKNPQAILITDLMGRITYVNQLAGTLFHCFPKRLIGKLLADIFSPEDQEESDNSAFTHEHFGQKVRIKIEESNTEETYADWLALKDSDGSLSGMGILLYSSHLFSSPKEEDKIITKQQKKIHANVLEAIGRGYAHHFNNIITSMIGNLTLAMKNVPEELAIKKELSAAQSAAMQCKRLAQQMTTFAKGGAPVLKKIKIHDLIAQVLSEYAPASRYSIEADIAPYFPEIRIDPDQFHCLMGNLIQNAQQSMTKGGIITLYIRWANEDDFKKSSSHFHPEKKWDYFIIEVSDEGTGIGDQKIETLFEPFYTKRKSQHASGLGLAVARSIAIRHHGFLYLESLKEGTRAVFGLPVTQQKEKTSISVPLATIGKEKETTPPKENKEPKEIKKTPKPFDFTALQPLNEKTPKKEKPNKKNKPRILILEDEAMVRKLMVAQLKANAYEVSEAEEGSKAIKIYKNALKKNKPFDLFITDLTIPNGMGGEEAMKQIQQLDPNVRAIVSSGYSDQPIMQNYEDYGFLACLAKPYEPQDLTKTIEQALEKSTATL